MNHAPLNLLDRIRHRWLTRKAPHHPFAPGTTDPSTHKSQFGQDRWIQDQFFHGLSKGFFVDIGAHDGITFNNTWLLEQLGWQGIAIEPNPKAYSKLATQRHCTTLMCCVGDRNADVPFRMVTGYAEMLSGMQDHYDKRHDQRIKDEIAAMGGTAETILVPCRTLEDILASASVSHVDFMSIDTEGSELAILRSIDFSKTNFDVIAVENNYSNPAIPSLLSSAGYRLHSIVGDEFYVRNPS